MPSGTVNLCHVRRGPDRAEDALLTANIAKRKRAQAGPQRHQPDDHAEVADAVDDERLVRRVRGALALDVEADQEVGANAHQFPEHEHHQDVAGDHQPQHAEAEQRQILEEAVKAAGPVQMMPVGERDFVVDDFMQLVVHVAVSVKVNQGRNQRHHREHQHGQRVDVVADRQLQRAELAKLVQILGESLGGRGGKSVPGVPRLVGRRSAVCAIVGCVTVQRRTESLPVMGGGDRDIVSSANVAKVPNSERRERQQEGAQDRTGRDIAGQVAGLAHARSEQRDQRKRGQRQQPCQAQQQR